MKDRYKVAGIALLALILAAPTWAQGRNGPPRDRNDNGPELGVARVSLTNGDVSLRRGDSQDQVQALGGMPMLVGDSIVTGRNSRAEVELGWANFIRLTANTEVRILDLGNRSYRIEVIAGAVTYSELPGGEADMDIDTEQTTVRPLKKGVYRVEALDTGQTNVIVRKGRAEVLSARGNDILKKGHSLVLRGGGPDAEIRSAKAGKKDSFDRWNERRDDLLRDHRYRRAWAFPASMYGFYGYPYWGFGGYYPYHRGFGFGGGVVIRSSHRGGGHHRGRR